MNIYSVRPEILPLAKKVIAEVCLQKSVDEMGLKKILNQLTKKNGGLLPRNLELVQAYRELVDEGKIANHPAVLKIIQKRKVRTLSGIANITVLTKNFSCPGKCIFCPSEPGMPKSYLSSEPAMMRAVHNRFDPYRQVKTRLNGLMAQGHDVSKIDIRTAGGTWGAVPRRYQMDFLKGIFYALNEGPGPIHEEIPLADCSLEELIKQNETAQCRCVGLWIETRPDWVDEAEIRRLRSYGVTGVELGVQTTDDRVNEFCKRGHGLKESIRATQLCRDAGLKIAHHLMPNLPTATPETDRKSGQDLFENEGLRPDYLKIYPTMVTPFSELAEMVKQDPSVHTAYSDEELMELIADIKKEVPSYCRIIRIIRDIPASHVIIGTKASNLRQIMRRKGVVCRCVRCREIQDEPITGHTLNTLEYSANGGREFFISADETTTGKLIGLCRLRLPDPASTPLFDELKGAAMVRELHVYGRQETLGEGKKIASNTQHLGFGRMLMKEAEDIALKEGYEKIAVIAAIGTREYYRKLGYQLEGTYMVKQLSSND